MSDIEKLAEAILRLVDSKSGGVSIKATGGGATVNVYVNLTVHNAPQWWKPSLLFRPKLLRVQREKGTP